MILIRPSPAPGDEAGRFGWHVRERDDSLGLPVRYGALRAVHLIAVATNRADSPEEQHLELPVEELLRRARPLPPHDEMVIEDLSAEEGEAFVLAVES